MQRIFLPKSHLPRSSLKTSISLLKKLGYTYLHFTVKLELHINSYVYVSRTVSFFMKASHEMKTYHVIMLVKVLKDGCTMYSILNLYLVHKTQNLYSIKHEPNLEII